MALDEKQLKLKVEFEATWKEMLQRVIDKRAEATILEGAVDLADLVRQAHIMGKTMIIYPNGQWVRK